MRISKRYAQHKIHGATFCEFDAAQPPATQPVCEQVSSGVFAYAKCDGWTTPTRNENPKEHVIAMFCSLLVFFSNLFLGVVERRIGIPKHPFALRTGFEWFVMDASHGAGHTLLKCFFSTNMPGISAGCDVDSVHGLPCIYIYIIYIYIYMCVCVIFFTCQDLFEMLFGGFKMRLYIYS